MRIHNISRNIIISIEFYISRQIFEPLYPLYAKKKSRIGRTNSINPFFIWYGFSAIYIYVQQLVPKSWGHRTALSTTTTTTSFHILPAAMANAQRNALRTCFALPNIERFYRMCVTVLRTVRHMYLMR